MITQVRNVITRKFELKFEKSTKRLPRKNKNVSLKQKTKKMPSSRKMSGQKRYTSKKYWKKLKLMTAITLLLSKITTKFSKSKSNSMRKCKKRLGFLLIMLRWCRKKVECLSESIEQALRTRTFSGQVTRKNLRIKTKSLKYSLLNPPKIALTCTVRSLQQQMR